MYSDETSCVKQGAALLVGGGLARYPGSEVCCLLSRRPLARDHGTRRKFSSSCQKAFPARAKVGGPSPWKLLERAPLSESSGMNPIQPQPPRWNVHYGELWGVENVNQGGRIFRRAIKGAIEKGKRVGHLDTERLTKGKSRGHFYWNLGRIQTDHNTLEIVIEPPD